MKTLKKNLKKYFDEIEKYHNQDLAFFMIRLFLAVLFVPAGVSKLTGLSFGNYLFGSLSLTLLVGLAELICGLMLLVGFYSKWAGLILSFVMAGAILLVHNPLVNMDELMNAELRLIVLVSALSIFLCGSGKIAYKKD